MWIDITVDSQKLLLGTIYRPEDNILFYDNLHKLIEPLCIKRNNITLLGDFNSDLLFRGKSIDESYLGRKLLNVLNNYGLKNAIKNPTRITENTSTIIDLIITSDTSKIIASGCYDTGISDHNIVYSVINLKRKKSKPVLKEVCKFKNVNMNVVRTDLEQAPLYVCSLFEDLYDTTWAWEKMYKEIMKGHVPKRKQR